jgi:Pyridoxamine 5'-phosphate oxidase
MIDKQLAEFLEEGIAIHIGTRNEQLEPDGARVTAVTVEEDGTHLVAYVPTVAAARVLPNLQANGQAALVFGRPTDDRACQVKGVFTGSRETTPDERDIVLAQWERSIQVFERVGIPRAASATWVMWPCVAVRLRATALFSQTPGPGAGAPLR